jgi:polyisoprenoid-binding protein YceI
LLTLTLLLASATLIAAEPYQVDTVHSSVVFHVSHNTVGIAYGRFNEFEGQVEFDGDKPTSFEVTVKTGSVDTANEKRDGHLRKPDFFNAKLFPEMTFTASKVEKSGDGYKVSGDFTMLGVTKPATFEVKTTKAIESRGKKIRGVLAEGVIKRSEYGMNFGMGGIGDEVTVIASFEVVN